MARAWLAGAAVLLLGACGIWDPPPEQTPWRALDPTALAAALGSGTDPIGAMTSVTDMSGAQMVFVAAVHIGPEGTPPLRITLTRVDLLDDAVERDVVEAVLTRDAAGWRVRSLTTRATCRRGLAGALCR
ncbi:MAG: hypothetical protein AAFQ51_19870 [Pseudomonadota bacterium]